jgi:hypothetical protein
MAGLSWVLGVMETVRNPATITEGFFRFFKNGYRTLEFSCLKNRGGRFVELCDYLSGAQRGVICIPEGRNGAGWVRFVVELRRYFLGEKSAADGVGNVQKFRNQLHNVRNSKSQDVRRQRDGREEILQKPLKEIPRVLMSEEEPRPTRSFNFKWNPHPFTLVITKRDGESRKATWVGLSDVAGLKEIIEYTRPKKEELKTQSLDRVGPSVDCGLLASHRTT